MNEKKTLIFIDPQSYQEYDDSIDIKFSDPKKIKPIICVPIMDKEE
jgi:hypothetical protein